MKYAPLSGALLLLFGFIPVVIRDHVVVWPAILLEMVFPVLISTLLIGLFFVVRRKLKYVALGKSKVIIRRDRKEVEYNWVDVESIRLNRFLGLYKLKIKGEDDLYFTPYGMTTWLTGDDSEMGVIINKMKAELNI